tara:strand:- start:220 stop:834 length:615 start_codon:yes stop_codon:yes gene_type:complete
MIVLNNIGFYSGATFLQVALTAPVGDEFSTAKLWTSATYRDSTNFIDLFSYFPTGARTGLDIVTIPASVIGEALFNGVFYLEIQTTTGGSEGSFVAFAISNLTVYDTCILDKVLQTSVIDCVPTVTTDCGDLSSSQITFINTMLESLEYALLQSDFLSAQAIELCLMKLCTDDCGCTQTENASYFTGTYITDDVVISGVYSPLG